MYVCSLEQIFVASHWPTDEWLQPCSLCTFCPIRSFATCAITQIIAHFSMGVNVNKRSSHKLIFAMYSYALYFCRLAIYSIEVQTYTLNVSIISVCSTSCMNYSSPSTLSFCTKLMWTSFLVLVLCWLISIQSQHRIHALRPFWCIELLESEWTMLTSIHVIDIQLAMWQ